MATDNVTPIRPSTDPVPAPLSDAPETSGYEEPPAETAAMHLRQAHAILDLMATLTDQSADDPSVGLEALDTRTLSNALDAAKKHIEAAEELVERWPRLPTKGAEPA
jgi:hypothetical protein